MLSNPILWIPSHIWFKFLSKRMQTISHVQRRLYTIQPPNYGILTGLLTYLIQSVLFTPQKVSSYVNESLALLRFRQVVDRFGMFFLHDLDLDRKICLPPVLRMDDLGVLKALGVNLNKKKPDRSLDLDVPTEDCPLGEAPSWKDVQRCIKEHPWKLMRPWVWSDNLGLLNQTACQLFQHFTTHIWTCLNLKWRTNQDPIRPSTLQDAIHCWTLNEAHAQIKSVSFVPCNAELLGNVPGRRVPSFADRQSLYFPATSSGLVGYWKLMNTKPGYIAEYLEICERLTADEVSDLDADLSTLLSECQCLPLSIRIPESEKNTQQVIWKAHKQDILVLTNPKFYKLVRISNTLRHSSKRAPPAHTPKKALQMSLLELDGVSQDVARRVVNWSRALQKWSYDKTQKSGQAKNRRVPPQPKKKSIQEDRVSEIESEGELEEKGSEEEDYDDEDYEGEDYEEDYEEVDELVDDD